MSSPESPDVQLVARTRGGDSNALGELYALYARPLLALAQRLLGAGPDAEDVLHDVFLGLPEALRQYREQGTLLGWLKRVTARVALNRMRSERRRRTLPIADSHEQRRTLHQLDAIAVRDAMEVLPDALRAVFVLKVIEGFSHAEIATLMDITTGASEVRLHRALTSLRRALESPT